MKDFVCWLWYALIISKAAGYVTISWWLVLAPLWLPIATILFLLPILVAFHFVKLLRTIGSGQDYNPHF